MSDPELNILLVEDDHAYAALITELLERHGAASVTHCLRLRDALASLVSVALTLCFSISLCPTAGDWI